MNTMPDTVIDLEVRNHPGVMAQITGLFARRNFNLEGILCGPCQNPEISRIYLLVRSSGRLDQMEKQLAKLYDVLSVTTRRDFNHHLFYRIEEWVNKEHEGELRDAAPGDRGLGVRGRERDSGQREHEHHRSEAHRSDSLKDVVRHSSPSHWLHQA